MRGQNKDGNGRAKLQHKRTLARTNTPLSHEILHKQHHIKHHTFISSVFKLDGTVLEGFFGKGVLRIHDNPCKRLLTH